jgi:hypothetical protein
MEGKSAMGAAGTSLGEHYPHPLVHHDVARRKACRAVAAIEGKVNPIGFRQRMPTRYVYVLSKVSIV